MAAPAERLFATDNAGCSRTLHRLHAATVLTGICLALCYRVAHVPAARGRAAAWLGMLAAELWFGLYWVVTQSVRWCPVRRRAFADRLAARYGDRRLPCVDIFVCAADPQSEPPSLVAATVLSVMAYDYPPEKLSVYLSDDGCSAFTFYALWEASAFARHWIPFCKRRRVEPRSPAAYFSSESEEPRDSTVLQEWLFIKGLYEEMTERIDYAVNSGEIPEEIKVKHKAFSEWNAGITPNNHQPIVQIVIDGKDRNAVDNQGNALPTLVYVAREKRPGYRHHFKAGAMNALIRVSSVISNGPIIMNVDCDMYSNNSNSIKEALCFFLDDDKGRKIGFVQYPQNYNNLTKNNIYGNSLNVINQVEMCGIDGVGGQPYIGTGCFHRRETLCGRRFSEDYEEDWSQGITNDKTQQHCTDQIEEKAKSLATCTYELSNTNWGSEIGIMYDCPVEDVITGLSIHCRGWESVNVNPSRPAFVGVAPTTLAQTILQHKRFSEGNFSIFLSRYCPFVFGHGRIRFLHQMGYSVYGLWAPNSLPTLCYVIVPALGLLKGTRLFPEMTSPWIIPFVYVAVVTKAYSLYEALHSGDTLRGWWNGQRMWLVRRTTSYLYGFIDTIKKLLGVSSMAFVITPKVTSDQGQAKRYEQEIMEFGAFSTEFVIVAAVALLNLACLVGGLNRIVRGGGCGGGEMVLLDALFVQVVLCGMVVIISVPVYEAMFLRKDRGRMPPSVTVASSGLVMLAVLLVTVF